MAQLTIVTTAGKRGATLELDPSVFEAPVKPHLFHAEVRRQLAARRSGTHSTKNRHAVSGGGIKPWRQKGTGRARQGSIRSPQWAGGGAVFGPVPRGYEHSLPKKVRAAALRSALSQRLRDGALVVVDEIRLEGFKTKRVAEILAALELAGGSVLIVSEGPDALLERSARNLPGVSVLRAQGLNVYDVLRHAKLLFTRAAVASVQGRLARATREVAS
ncbi:MAG: 50S ribosomal protein L4 [Myxococcaceae bacterium]|nr:50S ribosomal protein L4 [Myxococcaceae bacterium]MCI0673153.1 50S ribosomal protein L4 [Myxococcaceae bacterium]